ncbi:acyl-CoA thioesterase [Actinocorallia herbida]|uniref:Acyl-CoA thioesterase n=1 Tax=Actinocorallia herbida TaxID=58109 RepID=A0A3N1D0S9_9ACTN|nr:thioesterase family protein [Actinocorallia herbida]ROO87129.1 acyl-CoA thioesterase [Actinocorallia herbida]
MSVLPEAFYLPADDGGFEPTRATQSLWDPDAQHGGPPTALLAHVLDGSAAAGTRMARISVDFLGPIPRRPARVAVTELRPGRLVRLAQADLVIDGRAAVTARAWYIATGPTPPVETPSAPPPPVPSAPDRPQTVASSDFGYGQAIEWRFTESDAPGTTGVWTRVRVPLVAGQDLTGLARALIVADSANGLSLTLPPDRWLSIPPTMTATLLRPPTGEWVHMECRTHLSDDGLGLAEATLRDPKGLLAEVAQPLLIRAR